MAKQVTMWQADDGSLHTTEELAHFADAFDRFLRDLDLEDVEIQPSEVGAVRSVLLGSIGETLALCILRVRAPHLLASGYCVETKAAP